MFKLLHFLALFGYLNILCFEVKFNNIIDFVPVEASETLLEVVLEEVLDLEHGPADEVLPELVFDEYTIFALALGVLPVVLIFSWLLRIHSSRIKEVKHPIYLSKTICLPGYYKFLYRYRPF